MNRNGMSTRERILETAHDMVLRQGYAATSLDQILTQTGVTKGAFFHHFKSKDELARALFDRYLAVEDQVVGMTLRRAEKLTSDPLQQVLVTLGLFEELFDALDAPHPGCLIASYLYQNDLMTPDATARSRDAFLIWRNALAEKLRAAAKVRPPRIAPDYEALGDMLNVIVEGAMVTSKLFDDPKIMVRQVRQLRSYIELLFAVEKKN
ncbi:MAG: TetR/AcrR family transcriptional regulator [Gammaproteobacteria bacterium]|nr:TetR/AcrR family transcriptional regulator [Gammaproteobacteria bacterium]